MYSNHASLANLFKLVLMSVPNPSSGWWDQVWHFVTANCVKLRPSGIFQTNQGETWEHERRVTIKICRCLFLSKANEKCSDRPIKDRFLCIELWSQCCKECKIIINIITPAFAQEKIYFSMIILFALFAWSTTFSSHSFTAVRKSYITWTWP